MDFQNFKTNDNKSLVQAVIDEIVYRIKKGELKPGDKIDSQRELAKKLNVARSCVREAIQALSLAKIIEVRQGKGAFVSPISLNSILNPVNMNVLMSRPELQDLLKVRMILETAAIREAVKNISQPDLKTLKKHMDQSREYLQKGKYDQYYVQDYEFHRTIVRCSRNNVLSSIFNFIFDLLIQGMKTISKVPGSPGRGLKWHNEIYRKMKDMDIEGSQEAMRNHIRQVMEDYNKLEN
ncbi:MAG: FadR/GntR family transcriptional regulator [Actinomycetota bacterium]|nr:FadR/GntR family transcriptional regulator [Actinomycetota bacterium]